MGGERFKIVSQPENLVQASLDYAVETTPITHRSRTRCISHTPCALQDAGGSAARSHLGHRAATDWTVDSCCGRGKALWRVLNNCSGLKVICYSLSLLIRTGHVALLNTKGARK